jgi:hypothetical protein
MKSTPFLTIWALCIGVAGGYGLCHMLVALAVCGICVVGEDSAGLLPAVVSVLKQGVFPASVLGAILGLPLAVLARQDEDSPKLTARDMQRPLVFLVILTGCIAVLFGSSGFLIARSGGLSLDPALLYRLPVAYHAFHTALVVAGMSALAAGASGSLLLYVWVWYKRGLLGQATPGQRSVRSSLVAIGLSLSFVVCIMFCGWLQWSLIGMSAGINNSYYYSGMVNMFLHISGEETLSINDDCQALRGPGIPHRSSNPDELPFGYTRLKLDPATCKHFLRLEQAWCAAPPTFPDVQDAEPHYSVNFNCANEDVYAKIPVNDVPPDLQRLLDAVPSPR